MKRLSLFKPLYFLWCFLLVLNSLSPFISRIQIQTAYAAEENSSEQQISKVTAVPELPAVSQPESKNSDLSPFVMPLLGAGMKGGGSYTYKLEGLIFNEDPNLNTSWTTGNVCQGGGGCYSEGDDVPSRLKITGLTALASYNVIIEHDYKDSLGTLGYLNFNRTDVILGDDNASGVSLNFIGNVSCSAGDICKDYDLSFLAGGDTAIIYWNSLLSLEAADWNGASLHFRLVSGIGGENVGQYRFL